MPKSNNRLIADLLSNNADEQLIFEGSTQDNNETIVRVTDPTADRTITYPDDSGVVALTKNTVSNTVFQSSLANTNLAISTETARVDLLNTNLTSTNSAIRTLVSDRMQVSNVQSYIANTNSRLTVLEEESGVTSDTLITTSETTVAGEGNTSIDTVATSTTDAVTYNIVSTKNGDYNFTTISAVKNSGGSINFTEYGSIDGDTSLSTFSVDISGSNITLYADPTTTGVTFKITRIIVLS